MTINRTRLTVIFQALACALIFVLSIPAMGRDDESLKFDIAAQPLVPALKAFAEQANMQLLYKHEAVEGANANAVVGSFERREALAQLLRGTGLEMVFTAEDAATIRPRGRGGSSRMSDVSQIGGMRVVQNDTTRNSDENQERPDSSAANSSQGGADNLDEVVVTGSHIRGAENRTNPLTTITREQIDLAGFSTTQQLLQSIPQNASGGAAGVAEDGILSSGALSKTNVSAGSAINLRGLGTSSTLALLNGHRLPRTASGQAVDISLIPLSAIERVDIMTDGASSIYGTDAVAGVVNFITRKDYDGAETAVRYGSVTDGSRSEQLLTQLVGHNWSGGNALVNLQYQHFDALSSSERSFAASAPEPTDLLPESRQYAIMLNAQQALTKNLDIYGDVSFVDRNSSRDYTTATLTQAWEADTQQKSASLGGSYSTFGDWQITLNGLYSEENTDSTIVTLPPVSSCQNGTTCSEQTYKLQSVELIADGSLLSLPAGKIKAAIGSSYRDEDFSAFFPTTLQHQHQAANLKAVFLETSVPLVSRESHIPAIESLTLSASVRRDDYNDVGGTTNPRYGIAWSPVNGLNIRASYSESFRAANAFEKDSNSLQPLVLTTRVAAPAGGTTPVLVLIQDNQTLSPETSRNNTFGVDYAPQFTADLRISLDYYKIDFRNRIIKPSFDTGALLRPQVYGPIITGLPDDAAAQTYVNDILDRGGTYFNFTGGSLAGVRYAFNFQRQNAARVQQNGFDLSIDKRFQIGEGRLTARLSGTYIDEILTAFTATSTANDIVDTYSNPLHLRMRADLGWSIGEWGLFAAFNRANSYVDTSAIPYAKVSAWTTVDLNVHYKPALVQGLSVSLAAINLVDKDPPRAAGLGLTGIHYDVGNATPLGRFLSLELRKTW
jgi:outer membrane receptor protein involved in Fe transport